MVGKTDLEYMLDKSGFGDATEMGEFALQKGPEVYLVPKTFHKSIFIQSASVGAAAKRSVSEYFFPSDSLNIKPPTLLLLLL